MRFASLLKPGPHKSPYAWILAFWFFLSVPRFIYLYRSGILLPWSESLPYLALGLMRDGLIAAPLLLFTRAFHGKIVLLPRPTFSRFIMGAAALCAIIVSVQMVNADVLRKSGVPLTAEYFSFLFDSEHGLGLFVEDGDSLWSLAFAIAVLPVIFFVAAVRLKSWKVDWFLRSRPGIALIVLLGAGGIAGARVTVPERPQSMAANITLNSLFRQLFSTDELGGRGRLKMRDILGTLPLPKDGHPEPEWKYVDVRYPLIKATDHHLCRAGLVSGPACEEDADKDGHPVRTDCNDRNPGVHPGRPDVPRNGIDEDCSGIDAEPPNVIFIHWEGARAWNVGSIGPGRPSTPRFDALAEKGVLFTNAYSNGLQTRFSIVPMYCSTMDRLSTKWICAHNPELHLLSFPAVLRSRGYETIYMHGGENSFGSHDRRLPEWFERVYDRRTPPLNEAPTVGWGLRDKELFAHALSILKSRRDRNRPFLLAVATLSLHFPMKLPDPRYEFVPHRSYDNKVSNLLRYADDALGDFIEAVQADPAFENTIILVSADHGLMGRVPDRASEIVTWIPMALIGKGWNMPPQRISEVRQTADIAPTILDRLGIDVPNPFIGQSLLRRFRDREGRVFSGTANSGLSAATRLNQWRYRLDMTSGEECLFDVEADRLCLRDRIRDPKLRSMRIRLAQEVNDFYRESGKLIEEDRIWDPRYVRFDRSSP